MHLGSQGFLDIPSPVFQIQILLLIGRSMMLWVLSTDRVQNLLQALEHSLGIPSALQRLLYGGKQLDASFPLSFYNIERDATLVLSLHLRGGAAEHSSSTPTFSYKDVFHAQPKKAAQSLVALKTFLVDKMEEVLSIDISHPDLADQLQKYAKVAIICRFNGLWPRTKDLYEWIYANWTHNWTIIFFSKGLFLVIFDHSKDYQKALTEIPWFWGTTGLFLIPWFLDFDPSTTVITKIPVWVRLSNLPAHLWHLSIFQGIGNTLCRYLIIDPLLEYQALYTYGRICVEIDISKGLPDQMKVV